MNYDTFKDIFETEKKNLASNLETLYSDMKDSANNVRWGLRPQFENFYNGVATSKENFLISVTNTVKNNPFLFWMVQKFANFTVWKMCRRYLKNVNKFRKDYLKGKYDKYF